MNLMLSAIIVCSVIGLFAPRFSRGTMALVALVATAMTVAYYVFPLRFM
jgi:hypothetical protein